MERRKPELLAPAGDMERLRAAVDYGADAVYLGGKNFGMRSAPANFSCQELEEGVALCHRRRVKVYVTCNTLPRNQELPEMVPFLKFCQEAGVDGFILSDLGVLALAPEQAPQGERPALLPIYSARGGGVYAGQPKRGRAWGIFSTTSP